MRHTPPPRPAWRRSSHSGDGNNCVEVAFLGSDVAVRDSKNPEAPPVALSPPAWRALLGQVKAGRLDL